MARRHGRSRAGMALGVLLLLAAQAPDSAAQAVVEGDVRVEDPQSATRDLQYEISTLRRGLRPTPGREAAFREFESHLSNLEGHLIKLAVLQQVDASLDQLRDVQGSVSSEVAALQRLASEAAVPLSPEVLQSILNVRASEPK